jgi:phosphoribosylaminoimidazolecarboxamide formyltransferase/IMP cyclohydrolase
MKITRALISVSDKTGVDKLAAFLAGMGVEILSTGGTAKFLREKGIKVIDVSEYTGFPEIMDGRVKTLHPKVHGGILGIRANKEHCESLNKLGIPFIDMVVVNLYPFEATIKKSNVTLEDAIENIDIGGPTMIRAAAKNWQDVVVLVDPADYEKAMEYIKAGDVPKEFKMQLSAKVYTHTARYDGMISSYLTGLSGENGKMFPEALNFQFYKAQECRYGENPHQKAAFYREKSPSFACVSTAKQLQGKELSYNNILDTDSSFRIALDFKEPAACIVKHNNPCGVAIASVLVDAFVNARACDPVSAFGGIVAFNRKVDAATAQEIIKGYVEVVIAPGYEKGALEALANKKDIRVLDVEGQPFGMEGMEMRRVLGGLLVQEFDAPTFDASTIKVVTKRAPTAQELKGLEFAWKVCKHVKSNAILITTDTATVGVGAGQMSRVDSSKISISKALSSTKGCVVASDAFFPFPDALEALIAAGITAVIQPGGSVKDNEAIATADKHNIAMVMTGQRHFKH